MGSVLPRVASLILGTTKGVRIITVKTLRFWVILITLGVVIPGQSYAGGMMSSTSKAEQELLETVTEAGHRLKWRTASLGHYVMDFPEGRILREIAGSGTVALSFSPYATELAFFDARSSSAASLWIVLMDLMVAEIETGERKPLGLVVRDPSLLAWSPDGQKLALIAAWASTDMQVSPPQGLLQRSNKLFIFSIRDKTLETLNLPQEPVNWVNSDQIWSPDGTELLYVVSRDPDYNKFLGEIRILTLKTSTSRFLAYGRQPAWSPIDDRITFQAPDESHHLIHADGHGQELLLKPKPRFIHRYDLLSPFLWSPDGRWLLVPRGSKPGMVDLYAMDPNTKTMVRIQTDTQPPSSWKGRRE